MIEYQTPKTQDPWERLCWVLIAVGYGIMLIGWLVARFANPAILVELWCRVAALGIATTAFFVGFKARGQLRRLDYLRTGLVIVLGILSLFRF